MRRRKMASSLHNTILSDVVVLARRPKGWLLHDSTSYNGLRAHPNSIDYLSCNPEPLTASGEPASNDIALSTSPLECCSINASKRNVISRPRPFSSDHTSTTSVLLLLYSCES